MCGEAVKCVGGCVWQRWWYFLLKQWKREGEEGWWCRLTAHLWLGVVVSAFSEALWPAVDVTPVLVSEILPRRRKKRLHGET